MTKKEEYDKKIEILKKFLESDGDIATLVKLQNEYNKEKTEKEESEIKDNIKI